MSTAGCWLCLCKFSPCLGGRRLRDEAHTTASDSARVKAGSRLSRCKGENANVSLRPRYHVSYSCVCKKCGTMACSTLLQNCLITLPSEGEGEDLLPFHYSPGLKAGPIRRSDRNRKWRTKRAESCWGESEGSGIFQALLVFLSTA